MDCLKLAILDQSFYVEETETGYIFTGLDLERTLIVDKKKIILKDTLNEFEHEVEYIQVILENKKGILMFLDKGCQVSVEFQILDKSDEGD